MENKIAAAVAGVLNYLQIEKEQKQQDGIPVSSPSPWALFGRQSIMQMRNLVQRRVLKR